LHHSDKKPGNNISERGFIVQTCSKCQTQTTDLTMVCPNCGAKLSEFSTTAVALQKFRDNPRVKTLRLVVAHDACPACQAMEGTYDKEKTPALPIAGCSHASGCRCFFEPTLTEIYP
jgi:RNA polymerase subunit RPABC4/transcription elongation factor Spt4